MSEPAPSFEERAAKQITARDQQIPKEYQYDPTTLLPIPSQFYRQVLKPRQIEIVELDATHLALAIANKTYTAMEVIEAYLHSACAAHAGTKCLAWLDADAARERARWLDSEMERNGPVGPLHGVPMSVKDFMCVKGFTQTSGHLSSLVTPDEDADMTAIFRQAGVVFYAKTTQPQSIMHLETSNFYGTTTNAFNRKLTCGGSSGGEGALVACHGSPIGITTDVGGSTRNPAAFNGLWGFKPSSKRVPREGVLGTTALTRIAGAIGPVTHSLQDLDLFYRVLFATPTWKHDIKLVPLGWRDVDENGKGIGFDGWSGTGKKLRVGIMWDDRVVRPVKPIRRAMKAMVGKLKTREDVEVVDFPAELFEEAWKLTNELYYTDGGANLRKALGDEPMRPLTEWIVSKVHTLTREEVESRISRRNQIRQLYYDRFNAEKLDVILSPAGPAPAQPVGTTKYWAYTSFWNLLDWPAAVFPTGLRVGKEDAEGYPQPKNEDEAHLYSTYSAEVAAGSPIGLQVIAPRWQDERLMAALRHLERSLPL